MKVLNNDKLVSIIIPTYNREKTISYSVDSVLNQTYKNIEIIIVDDCSTDNTFSIISQIKDDRIKYIKLENNSGACVARNKGILEAKGEIIAFHDSDDFMHPNRIEKQLNNLLKNNYNLSFCKFNFISNSTKEIRPSLKKIVRLKLIGLHNSLIYGNLVSTQCIMGEKKIIAEIMFDKELPRFQDYDFVLRSSKKYRWGLINECLVDVIEQSDSISINTKKLLLAIEIMIKKDYGYNTKKSELLNDKLYLAYGFALYGENKSEALKIIKKYLHKRKDFITWIKYKHLKRIKNGDD